MTQFQTPAVRRRGGDLDVYTGLLLVATIVLAVGVTLLAMTNIEHSKDGTTQGGVLTLVR
jgi:hypothetical protein